MQAGAYLPEYFLIKIHSDISDFYTGKVEPKKIGIIFHEYLHYLHNLTTGSGLSTFINILELWVLFRKYLTTCNGVGLSDAEKKHLQAVIKFLMFNREASRNFTNLSSPISIVVTSLSPVEVLNQGDLQLFSLEGSATIVDTLGHAENVHLSIKIHDILESVAWLLEKNYYQQQGIAFPQPPVFPYEVASALMEFYSPNLSDGQKIEILLSALQSTEVITSIYELSTLISKEPTKASAQNHLKEHESRTVRFIDNLKQRYHQNLPFSRGIVNLLNLIQLGIEQRLKEPFFEFKILESLRTKDYREVFRENFPCTVIEEYPGNIDQLRRDRLLTQHNDDVEESLRVVHSALHYMYRHLTGSGFKGSDKIEPCRCPFYTICSLSLRTTEQNICKETPWKSANWTGWPQGKTCWYGEGVRSAKL